MDSEEIQDFYSLKLTNSFKVKKNSNVIAIWLLKSKDKVHHKARHESFRYIRIYSRSFVYNTRIWYYGIKSRDYTSFYCRLNYLFPYRKKSELLQISLRTPCYVHNIINLFSCLSLYWYSSRLIWFILNFEKNGQFLPRCISIKFIFLKSVCLSIELS